jgi:GrpB-like predicted nucleotidyltransferase (UPF0157 family)
VEIRSAAPVGRDILFRCLPKGTAAMDIPAPLSDDQIRSHLVDGADEPTYQPIVIADYDPEWPRLFRREADRVRAALGERVRLLAHVGSTSVPGLPAKPLIDMLLVVPDSAAESAYLPDLAAVGYRLRLREPEWHEHRVIKGPDTNINMHTVSVGCPEIERWLMFRDWLREHADDRARYAAAKRELATRQWKFVQNYADAKSEVVLAILARAQASHS